MDEDALSDAREIKRFLRFKLFTPAKAAQDPLCRFDVSPITENKVINVQTWKGRKLRITFPESPKRFRILEITDDVGPDCRREFLVETAQEVIATLVEYFGLE